MSSRIQLKIPTAPNAAKTTVVPVVNLATSAAPTAVMAPSAKPEARTKAALLPVSMGKTRDGLQIVAKDTASIVSPPRANPMVELIELESEARACKTIGELGYAIVNSTRKLLTFDQAFLLELNPITQKFKIVVASSTQSVDRHGTLARALEAFVNDPAHRAALLLDKPQRTKLPDDEASTAAFPFALWVPLKNRSATTHVMLALKNQDWDPAFEALVQPLAGAYGHALAALQPKTVASRESVRRFVTKKAAGFAAAIAAVMMALIPVPLTALAPAEIVAASPELITAPMDGVIEDILVAAGAPVDRNTPLVRFADTKARNELELAAKAKSVAEAKYFRVLQSAVSTQKDMQELSVAKAELAMAEADLSYAREIQSRVVLKANKPGLAIYSTKSDWIGKPVATGERIMDIADPTKTEVRVDVPVSDAIALKQGGEVSLFLDGDPLHAVAATIERVSYRPSMTPDKQMVFKIAAKFNKPEAHRIGLRGTARLSGETVSLGFYLFRRPMAYLRQKIGW
jgi:hypothetical protein